MTIIGIDYDEYVEGGVMDTYRGVTVSKSVGVDSKVEVFNTGDPVRDFANALSSARRYPSPVMLSSSCDHFVNDSEDYEWDKDEMIVRRDYTTNLDELRAGARFAVGELIKVHEIGPYAVVEAYDWKPGTRVVSDMISYHPYVNGKSLKFYVPFLDQALALAIAYRHEGETGSAAAAARYFIRMIGGIA